PFRWRQHQIRSDPALNSDINSLYTLCIFIQNYRNNLLILYQNLGDLLTPKILYDAAITAVGDVSLKSAINNYSLIIFCGSMVVNKEPSHFTTIIPASVLVNINSSTNCLIVGDTRISSSSNEYSGYIKVFMKNASVLSIAEINGKNSSSVQLYKVFGL
ncbi:MAG: hypothetical protein ACLVLH_24900, partial [Eisenbergiella massiliensis]